MNLDGPHWQFALSLYGQPGVAESCLALQDRYGVDVNVLLIALFALTERGVALNSQDVKHADDAVRAWRREVVQPLRGIRRRLKSGPSPAPSPATEDLRSRIKKAELDAEQIEQAVLAAWLDHALAGRDRRASRVVDIVGTITRYYHVLERPDDASGAVAIEVDTGAIERALTGAPNVLA